MSKKRTAGTKEMDNPKTQTRKDENTNRRTTLNKREEREKGLNLTSPASSTALSNPGMKTLPTPQASASTDLSYIRAFPQARNSNLVVPSSRKQTLKLDRPKWLPE